MGQWIEKPYTQYLRGLLEDYVRCTMPSNPNSSAPCSVADARKIVQNTADVLDKFIVKLEELDRMS